MSINIIASIVSFGVTIGINFFLTPYLVKEVGTDAYGFIGLANNFVQYATIVTTALNAISGRFISIAYHKGDIDRSSKIFSSVLVADLFLAAVMLILSAVFVGLLDLILNIPENLIVSVKITFGFAFLTGWSSPRRAAATGCSTPNPPAARILPRAAWSPCTTTRKPRRKCMWRAISRCWAPRRCTQASAWHCWC